MARTWMNGLVLIIFFISFNQCNKRMGVTNPPAIDTLFQSTGMKTSAMVNHLYIDTIHLSGNCDDCTLSVLSSTARSLIILQDSIVSWIPQLTDTGNVLISIQVSRKQKVIDSLSWNILVSGDWPTGCANYVHKADVAIANASTLPAGYFVYNPYTETGVYASPIEAFDPYLVPNTKADRPGNLSISDDGNWILYVDLSRNRIVLITISGCNKTIVPTLNCDPGFPTIAGFYRQSPYQSELFYLASTSVLKSVKVDIKNGSPIFSNDRVVADLSDKYHFNSADFMQISLVKDQLFSEISPIVNGKIISRTGYLTIPDGGCGVGGPLDVYQWLNDPLVVEGCGHTQSHDGRLCLANAGGLVGSTQCVPHGHKGFYVTSFRKVSEPPIDMLTEHIDKYGISVNWCPSEYQERSYNEVDFWGWYFGNRNDLVIGRQMGTLNENGIWIVDWQQNIWYRLTPIAKNIQTLQPAVYFYHDTLAQINNVLCQEDTTEKPLPYNPNADFFNPHYRIIKPSGGETFNVGDPCSVFVASTRSGNAILYWSLNSGRSWSPVPELNRSINPLQDSIVTFLIPDSIFSGNTMTSTISSKCLLLLQDYGNSNYKDISDSTFNIIGSVLK